ncbi:MAG: 1-acyl-sn-glycerol-3-phosphate acyltransferase [Flavobacteriales bacterium]|jgi:1-acyl-sn-glycerol-3-phosphate acyltransferase|nr:1-acyl-sn-glycerol-3-phosphate acyltransferase [Flavobacteriales bacterium]MBK6881792.1 1-acyl-sn-glycerol-3-phosphate acyltransferase [Flavobacteriales bacterium]MBK7102555.1 1-acyl-sn-glycerol-3-phosphate acyltransferase [Flavobacteriales bacterium]MBK7113288.1 1-acyl-sn-glycerol-3-phosphate acyltransferase [Flavobacteriales bacterium]MBK7482709.1 1-acyl-sn-glycerol-3-phosphate acyltransferase [Flavobacteriales bacterium]
MPPCQSLFSRSIFLEVTETISNERIRVMDGESRRSPVLKWVFLPLRLLYKCYFALVFFLSLVVLYIPFRILLFRPKRYQMAFRLKRTWAFFLQWVSGVPVRVERRAILPKAPYIICSNHSSYLDIIQMYNVIPEYFLFMGKYELLRWPLFNMFFKDMNIAVNRGSHVEAAKAFRRAANALDRGTSLALFPEGTIPVFTPRLKPFKDGAFKLAIEKQVPIVPVTFLDHWRLFGEPTDLLSRGHPGFARAVIHPAISTVGLTMDDLVILRTQVYRTIEEPLLDE